MLRLRRHLPIVIAACLALRALVPVGYMLQAPGGGDRFGFELSLCPTQNPGLNLDTLGPAEAFQSLHKHHAPSELAADNPVAVLDAGNVCSDWLNSSLAVALSLPPLVPGNGIDVYTLPTYYAPADLRRRGAAQPRAPPV